MPYPTEHAARIARPQQFVGFRRKNDAFGPGVDVIYGVRAKRGPAGGQTEVQSIRFDATDYTAAQAKRWLADNGFAPILFEPARKPRTNPSRHKAAERYASAHWGVEPDRTFRVHHPALRRGQHIVQMGELVTLEYRNPETRRLERIDFDPGEGHVAFTPDKAERLILLTSDDARQTLAGFAVGPWDALPEVHADVGGRQARFPCPDRAVTCLGRFTRIVYRTGKGDDLEADGWVASDYVHRMGEHGGIEPELCVDLDGYLHVAGGSYRVPDRGIIH